MSGDAADAKVLRGATRRLALLTAAAVTLVLLLVGALLTAVVWREQRGEARSALRDAVTDLDDLTRTPPTIGIWVQEADGTVQTSPAAPDWLPVRAALGSVSPARPRVEQVVEHNGEHYELLTLRSGGRVAQAVTGTSQQTRERDRLLSALVIAEVTGLGLSLLLGGLLARRAISPLATALARQRRFVADASHELRTPLTLLSTRAQLLERSLRRTDSRAADQHDEAVALVEDTRRLAEVVDDLLLSASLTAQPGRREPVDLVGLSRSAVSAAAAHAAQRGITVTGPADDAAAVPTLGAPGPLRRVLDALVDNAVSHSRPGGHVDVRVEPGPPARVQVVDDGAGIDPEVAPRLFDRFAHGQGTGTRRHFGLGLALVREVVEAHHGTVAAGPTPGGGATFTVTLPRQETR